ncbi:tetratricopeptide repeat protein [Streptomyces solisilvae]|uniref:tetratricopeptide repeat protein n=1 Tax=Streptomyces malaysiensis TaxID=92644 RepID=UPI00331CC553
MNGEPSAAPRPDRHEESPESREAALRRVVVWYLHSADAAQTWINSQEAHIPLDPPGDDLTPASFADYEEAMRWYEAERGNLLAATRAAEEAGLDVIAWQLPAVLRSVHMLLNPFEEWLAMSRIGLRAARRLGDRAAEAELLESLVIHLRGRRLEAAKDQFEQAAARFQELGAAQWQAVVTSNLAEVTYELARTEEASGFVERALAMHRELGNQGGEGNALRILSAVQRDRGQAEEALRSAEAALDIARTHRNHMWEGYWLLELGRAQRANGELDAALVSFQRAASLQRRLGDQAREARAWHGAGETYRRLGRPGEAADFHRRAAAVHRELDDLWHAALALDGLAGALREADEGDGTGAAEEARRHWAEALRALVSYDDPRAVTLRERVSAALAQ